ncbi:MAG TPA: hypothetical protein VLF95_12465 [Vicinamibacteria bacterium]|nr:hypothetical protein [Vicinamibacteria bacterium]
MGDPSQRRPWTEAPDEEAPPESWLTLSDDELLHRIGTFDARENEDDRLLEVVASNRHFFIRQEAAKRVRDRGRLFAFEDDRHVGQILVRHLTRREDVTYLERLSNHSHHAEVRAAAQVQLARLWRRLDAPKPAGEPTPAPPGPPTTPAPPPEPVTSDALASDGVDGSLLGWAAHFVVEQVWSHLGTSATRELLLRTRRDLLGRHPTLVLFDVTEYAQVTANLGAGLRLPREAVAAVAAWLSALREAAREVAPDIEKKSVRGVTALVADALSDAGFYTACDEFEAGLRR